MRSIWLASAALFMTAGVACAQTTTSTPAPTGAVQAPTMVPPGAAPGKTAPPSTGPAETMQPVSAPQPAPMASQPMQHHNHAHHWKHNGEMPANAGPRVYLHIAKSALDHHDFTRADEALSHAETRLLTRSVVQSSTAPTDHSPAVTAIENARHAAQAHNQMAALNATDEAVQAVRMHHHSQPMHSQPMQRNGIGPASMNLGAPAVTGNTAPQTQVARPTSSAMQPVTPGGDDGSANPAATGNSMPQTQVTTPTTAMQQPAPTSPAMQAPKTN